MGTTYPEESLLVGAAESIWNGSEVQINIGITAGDKLVSAMASFFPNMLECVFITDSDIRHIMNKHGANEEERGQLPIEPADFGYIPSILDEFDTCEHTDVDRLGNKKFLLTKNMGHMVYLVTIQRGNRKMGIKTMWKKRMPGAS